MYDPFQPLRQVFGLGFHCLGCTILLSADDGRRCPADLMDLFDIHQVATGLADAAIDLSSNARMDSSCFLWFRARRGKHSE